MRTFKTEGVVLKRKDFGEADRILTVFTNNRGKITVLAKGVRRITSRRAGNVELLNRVTMFLHQTKGMPILTEASSIDTFEKIKQDLTLSTYAYHILELVDKLTAENQENRSLYTELVEVLKRLEKKPRQILIRAFEAKILSNLGFISFKHFPSSNLDKIPQVQIRFHPKGAGSWGILQDLEIKSWDEIERVEINEKEALELEHILRYHLERVIESSLKSRQFLRKIR